MPSLFESHSLFGPSILLFLPVYEFTCSHHGDAKGTNPFKRRWRPNHSWRWRYQWIRGFPMISCKKTVERYLLTREGFQVKDGEGLETKQSSRSARSGEEPVPDAIQIEMRSWNCAQIWSVEFWHKHFGVEACFKNRAAFWAGDWWSQHYSTRRLASSNNYTINTLFIPCNWQIQLIKQVFFFFYT